MSDYRLVVHMSPNFHDNPTAPYFWCIMKYEGGLSNSGSGWAVTPERAFIAGHNYLNKYILSGEIEKPYPVLGGRQKEYIPFGVLAPHEEQALINHGQSLERLAERGGLGWSEMLAILEDRKFKNIEESLAKKRVLEYVSLWEKQKK